MDLPEFESVLPLHLSALLFSSSPSSSFWTKHLTRTWSPCLRTNPPILLVRKEEEERVSAHNAVFVRIDVEMKVCTSGSYLSVCATVSPPSFHSFTLRQRISSGEGMRGRERWGWGQRGERWRPVWGWDVGCGISLCHRP